MYRLTRVRHYVCRLEADRRLPGSDPGNGNEFEVRRPLIPSWGVQVRDTTPATARPPQFPHPRHPFLKPRYPFQPIPLFSNPSHGAIPLTLLTAAINPSRFAITTEHLADTVSPRLTISRSSEKL
jgi:hypothetical protein